MGQEASNASPLPHTPIPAENVNETGGTARSSPSSSLPRSLKSYSVVCEYRGADQGVEEYSLDQTIPKLVPSLGVISGFGIRPGRHVRRTK